MSDLHSDAERRPLSFASTAAPSWARTLALGTIAVMLLSILPVAFAAGTHAASTVSPVTAPSTGAGVPTSAGSSAVTSSGRTLGGYTPHGVVFNAPGPRPSAWGRAGVPPGWEAMQAGPSTPSTGGGWGSSGAGSPTGTNWNNRFCAGVWPGFPSAWGSSQGTYASGCYGHDEPNIDFYSTVPGSGGNVTWNVTLPVDRSATGNQSNLYSAIWFGMTLADPAAWMDQCFLELQFYPDQTFYNPGPLFPNATVNGAWIGAVVAWQIEASNGFENPCFYEPLYSNGVPGPAFLNMTQGDNILVKMTGYPGSTTGEALSIFDQTNGQASSVTLYNSTGGFPLNPAYGANNFENGLQWTPGGELPISFSFETGHAGNFNWPANNSYGGCSPGIKSTPSDPAAPCPSYDPGSWANDTLVPWKIQTPTFFNAHSTVKAAQVGFAQDFGGISMISQLTSTGCPNAAGSAWCSYPWYSYSCAQSAFNFGATDYATFSNDFGKYNEYAQYIQGNHLLFGLYPPTNFSVPTCSSPSYTVTVGTGGTGPGAAYFLSRADTVATAVSGVGPGTYSVNAINSGSGKFDHWVVTGKVTVAQMTSAYSSITVSGNGTLTAMFSSTPRTTKIVFNALPSGSIGLTPGLLFSGPFTGSGNPLATIASGGNWTLSPGTYGVQAYPPMGYVFSSWTGSTGATLASTAFPFTTLVVNGAKTTATVTAHFTKLANTTALTEVEVIGAGSVTFDGHTITGTATTPGFGVFHPVVGTYKLTSTPGAGNNQVEWLYGSAAVMTNFSQTTLVTIEDGFTFIEPVFVEQAAVTLTDSPTSAGAIVVVPPFGPTPAVATPSGTVQTLAPGNYTMVAAPFAGKAFVGWTVTGGVAVGSSTSPTTTLTVTSAGTVTASYSSATTAGVKFVPTPAGDGMIQLDGMTKMSTATTNTSLGIGLHTVTAIPSPGWVFSSWTVGGSHVALVGGPTGTDQVINVTGTGSSLTAVLTPGTFPFTFVAIQGNSSAITIKVNGVVLHSGDTEYMPTGHYNAPFAGGGLGFNGGWTATSNITFTNRGTTSSSFNFFGSATLYLILIQNGTGGGVAGGVPAHATTSTHTSTGVPASGLAVLFRLRPA